MIKTRTMILAAALVFLGAAVTQAQKVTLESGELAFLKGQQALNVEYKYDGMAVAKFAREEDFISKHKADLDKKEPGRGDQWLVSWYADRTNRFQPKFEELMNRMLKDHKTGLNVGRHPDAKYTLIVKTTFLDTGWNVGIARRSAEVSLEATFVDAKDPAKSLAVVSLKKAPGRDAWGADYDTGARLQEGYAKAGKELANFIYKKGLK